MKLTNGEFISEEQQKHKDNKPDQPYNLQVCISWIRLLTISKYAVFCFILGDVNLGKKEGRGNQEVEAAHNTLYMPTYSFLVGFPHFPSLAFFSFCLLS